MTIKQYFKFRMKQILLRTEVGNYTSIVMVFDGMKESVSASMYRQYQLDLIEAHNSKQH